MDNNMITKIIKIREGNQSELLEFIEIFNPLLNKYGRLLDGEDTKQDLIVFLIGLINKIPIENKRLSEDKAIFSYIATSLRNYYIKLSQKISKKNINEMELNLDLEIGHEEFESELEMLDMFKVLSEKEAYIIKLIYVHYLSVSEVADYMKISRQAVNQTKNRALEKIKNLYLSI